MSGKDDWGYVERKDLPERVIPIPPQAVPRNELSRLVDNAVKNPPEASVAFFQVQYAKQCDDTQLLAQSNLNASASGGGGVKNDTSQTWYTRIGRFCRTTTVQHSSGSFGFAESRVGVDFSLFSLASASAQPAPWALRIEDVISGELTVSVAGTVSGCIHFGLRQNSAVLATITPDGPFIGFYCVMLAAGYGDWYYCVAADGGTGAVQANTGITSELPHRLTIDINGSDGTVTFYIDGTLVGTVTGYAGTLSHPNDDGGVSWIVGAGGTGVHNCTCKAGYWMDLQANTSVRVLDEVA